MARATKKARDHVHSPITLGDYKGFRATANWDDEALIYSGKVISRDGHSNFQDLITFQARSFADLSGEFFVSVDEYLAFTKEGD